MPKTFKAAFLLLFIVATGCAGGGGAKASTSAPTTTPSATDYVGLVDVGGFSLFLDCEGQGSPTVVLEAGIGEDSNDWTFVQPPVMDFTRVCTYDRAGLGSSDDAPAAFSHPSAGDQMEELHTLLGKAGIEPPYVLGGFSWGGTITRLFAHRYPDEVVAMVLVDSASEGQMSRSWDRAAGHRWAHVLDTDAAAVKINLARTKAELRAASSLGSLPLIVISHGVQFFPPAAEPLWTSYQNALARLSSDVTHVIATEFQHDSGLAGHPDLVVEAIREAVIAGRTGQPIPPCKRAFPQLNGGCVH